MEEIATVQRGGQPDRPFIRLLLAVLPVVLIAVLGSLVTTPNIPGWYAGLEKPKGTPPNWVFGPVWGALYALMTFAFWRVLGVPRQSRWRSLGITAFAAQLMLNLAWSCVFFGLHAPLAAFSVIVLLLAAILTCIFVFRQMDATSALAMTPYALWVVYATYLNAGVWWLNR